MLPNDRQVLVISRSSVDATRLGIIFMCLGFQPLPARTPGEAINIAQRSAPTLIFFDTDMPGKELQSVLSVLRLEPSTKDLPLIVTTDKRNAHGAEWLLAMGCAEVLTKPIDVAQVYQMLGNVFGITRKSLRVPVLISVEVAGGLREMMLDCTNISETGMFICADEPLPERTVVHVKFTLPLRSEHLDLKAEVERIITLDNGGAESGMGLKFLDISERERLEIRRFVQQSTVGVLSWEHDPKTFDHALNKKGGAKEGGQ